MKNDTLLVNVRLAISTGYDKFCQCSIVSVNLLYAGQEWML